MPVEISKGNAQMPPTGKTASLAPKIDARAAVDAIPRSYNFAADVLARNLKAGRAGKPAYIDPRGSWTYGQLAERVDRFGAGLRALGIRREERILLALLDTIDWPTAFLGAVKAGVVPIPVNTLMTEDDYRFMLADSRAQVLIVSEELFPKLANLIGASPDLAHVIVSGANAQGHRRFEDLLTSAPSGSYTAPTTCDDISFWLYTSGSTGKYKAALHLHADMVHTAELYAVGVLGLRESDLIFSAAKLFFAYGLGNALSFPLSVGATVVLMAERPTPDATFKRWLGDTASQGPGRRPTVFFGAPTGYAGMLASPNLPAHRSVALRLCSSAGEALPADIGRRFTEHFGCEIIDGIGSTEMLHIFLSNLPGKVRYGTTGWPVPGYAVELRGDDGRPVADGETGDLYIQGPSAALMYWGNREKSRETFQGAWTKSGDKYVRNADGSYTYAGRSDDMLKVSGIYVSPFEVEATLVQHPAVLEAAVIGVPDPEGLTRTKAFVVLKPGQHATDEELKAFVKERLAPYKYPRLIEFIAELPKTATGKIQRFKLRDLEARR